MKDKILEIIERECWASGTECCPTGQLEGAHSAADEICQMMADELIKVMNFSSVTRDRSQQTLYILNLCFTDNQIDNALNKLK